MCYSVVGILAGWLHARDGGRLFPSQSRPCLFSSFADLLHAGAARGVRIFVEYIFVMFSL